MSVGMRIATQSSAYGVFSILRAGIYAWVEDIGSMVLVRPVGIRAVGVADEWVIGRRAVVIVVKRGVVWHLACAASCTIRNGSLSLGKCNIVNLGNVVGGRMLGC